MKSKYYLIVLLILCILPACVGRFAKGPEAPPVSPEAAHLLSVLDKTNQALETFKGSGRIRLEHEGKFQSERVAWIGSASGKLRFEVLGFSGQPVATIACDGERFYYRRGNTVHKFRSTDPSLKRVVSIPVKTSDIVTMMTGRVPLLEYHAASVLEDGGRRVLVLEQKWAGVREKIYFDTNADAVHKIEVFDLSGDLRYRAEFGRTREISGYQIPFSMTLSNDDNTSFLLHVSNYWANVSLAPSAFVLNEKEDRP